MQKIEALNYIEATFIGELKNRFLCEVDIDGRRVVCYVPSSCHLSNFLKLEGKRVLLVPTSAVRSRTQYALFAVPHKKSYILLNTSIANRAIENSIHSRKLACFGKRKNIIKEHYIDEYKSDLFIKDTNTIIEIKSVISMSTIANFPTVYSERTVHQLQHINLLLQKHRIVHFVIISLNPYVREIHIYLQSEFYKHLSLCIQNGLKLEAFSCRLSNDGYAYIDKKLPIINSN